MAEGDRGLSTPGGTERRQPNVLLVVSDQERHRGWLPASVRLPWRERLLAEGLEFTRYYTHSSPCSTGRSSLFTGRYLPGHGVLDNVIMPEHRELDPAIPTLGSLLGAAGYRCSDIGKWHLSQAAQPDMAAYGFADSEGGTVLGALESSGAWDDTVVIFTSDHGDMCGSHGLRSKGPFVYEEIMHVPLYVRVPGRTSPGTRTAALATHVDLAATICALAGVSDSGSPSVQGADLSPTFTNPETSVRDHVLFAQDSAQTENLNRVRYALRGFFDGRTKYARYYGVGGGKPSTGLWGKDPGRKLYDVGADFDDQDHEWYDHDADPLELVNLAHDRGRRRELRDLFERMRVYEEEEFVELVR